MDATKRFSDRVAHYRKYRPGYPETLVAELEQGGMLNTGAVVADIGAGTGLLAKLFLKRGYSVIGVEPNREMREAGDQELRGFGGYRSVDGAAESTGLESKSVDLVTAGQAFHWFKREEARREFSRILRGMRWVVLVWNERLVAGDAFLEAYEELLHRFGTDYKSVDHRNVRRADIEAFFGGPVAERIYPNRQDFDFEGVKGRLFSSSYAPKPEDPLSAAMVEHLRGAFDRYQRNGKVSFLYETKVYEGRVS